jgi:signal transduction histidine kinase/DNA-binding response OmpR family regulator
VERLLVVDDDSETRDFLEEFLSRHDYHVLTACDGEEGLQKARDENPDLILMDMQMPKMTGLDVINALKQDKRNIPVIFLTGHGSEALAVKAFRQGVRDYIPKPYRPQVILDAIERALREVRLSRERDQLTEQLLQANKTLQRQLQEINALYAIGKSVTSLLDVEQVLTRAVEAATFMTRAEEGSLMLLDEASGELYLRAAKNIDEKVARGLRMRAEDSLAGRVVRTGKPALLAGEGAKKLSTAYLAKTLLMIPLRVPDRGVIGVLVMANRDSDRIFTEHDLHLLSALTGYIAVAINNASLVADLQEEKSKLETILRETGDVVLVLDEQSCILICNRAARRAFSLGDEDILGRPVHEVINNREFLDLLTRPTDIAQSLNTGISLADGRTLNAHVSTITGVGHAVLMQDITHLEELARIKSEFVSTVSHDLRTPLTTIQGYVDLLHRVGPLTEQQQEFIFRVQRSLSAITDLVGDLLDIGRIEAGYDLDMVKTELEPIISEAVAELRPEAEAKGQGLRFHIPGDLPPVRGNPRRLRQVISNLVSNAIKYTPTGGHIVVEASMGDDHITISVTDDGFGIPLDDQPYVFDKFFRVDAPETLDIPGTGLGLSIVKSVIEKHGGRVWVESAPGEGSVFTVLLPKR